MLKLITLDLEGVFFEDPRDTYITNLAKYYRKTEAFMENLLFVDAVKYGQYEKLKLGVLDPEIYWNWFFEALDLGDDSQKNKDDYLRMAMGFYEINSDVVDLINDLRSQSQDVKIGLCSNNYSDKIEYLERKYGLSKYFDCMVFSYEVGSLKPDAAIFQALIKKGGCEPSEILYSDDKESNLLGAKELGISTHTYSTFGNFIECLKEHGLNI